ncbi:MAG: hypothetical protein ACHQ5A_06405 [Opitutales bacterium]
MLCSVILAALLPTRVLALAPIAQLVVAEIAQENLTPETKAHVQMILGQETISNVINLFDQDADKIWSSRIPLPHLSRRFPQVNGPWHNAAVPVGAVGYDAEAAYASGDDMLHAIQRSVTTLEGTNLGLMPREALVILVNLVANLHQPMQLVCGYYDLQDNTPRLLRPEEVTSQSLSDNNGRSASYSLGASLYALHDSRFLPFRGGNMIRRTMP